MSDHLSALDATFLELEEVDESAHMHIGAVSVFDAPPSGDAPSVEEVRAHLETRLDRLPRYRQHLSEPRTGGLQWPSWKHDPEFDLAAHVRHATLPAPGGDDELLEWAGDYYSHRLDRAHPLWEVVVLDGLKGGRWALVSKTHHCLVDGVGSVDAGYLLLDADAEPSGNGEAPPPPAEDERGGGGLVPAVIDRAVHLGADAARAGAHAIVHPRAAVARSRAMAEMLLHEELRAAPQSSLNVPIGGRRRLEAVRVDLAELKALRAALGGTVNDVILAAATGGLRELLLHRGEHPPASGLRAMVPVNLRGDADHGDLGNRITSLFVDLPVAEEQPFLRYEKVVEATRSRKSGTEGEGVTTLIDLTALAPPILHATIARSLYASRLFNVTITNVPGPQRTLYAFGAPLREVIPLVPLAADHAVGIAIVSYDGHVVFGLNADHETVADLHVLREGIESSLAQLHDLVQPGAHTQS